MNSFDLIKYAAYYEWVRRRASDDVKAHPHTRGDTARAFTSAHFFRTYILSALLNFSVHASVSDFCPFLSLRLPRFSNVVPTQTGNIELKKLVYLYLINYAKSQPESGKSITAICVGFCLYAE
jgi:hypothetical protein